MSLRINHNRPADDGVRSVDGSYQRLQDAMEKLSTGLRINRASDDPAGLVISEQLRARIASLNQEIENTTLTIRKYHTADATVSQLLSILHGIRYMAMAAADDNADAAGREAYQDAANRAIANYNRIKEAASFNNARLFDGGEGAVADLPPMTNIDLSSPESAAQAIIMVDQATQQLTVVQVDLGSTQKYELEARRSNLEVTLENLTAAESDIRDTDYPLAVAAMIKEEIKLQAELAMLAHANVTQRSIVSLMGG